MADPVPAYQLQHQMLAIYSTIQYKTASLTTQKLALAKITVTLMAVATLHVW